MVCKVTLLKTVHNNRNTTWYIEGFVVEGNESSFGTGKLSNVTWPTHYSGMDIIVNRITPPHVDAGGASSFYDHLLSLGQGHSTTLDLEDLDVQFAYPPGTSAFLTGRVLTHSMSHWVGDEQVVIAHYSKDDVHDRLGIARPSLPTNIGWWNLHGDGA